MIEICFWCKKLIGEVRPKVYKETQRGICPDCADVLKKRYRMSDALNAADTETLIKFLEKKLPA